MGKTGAIEEALRILDGRSGADREREPQQCRGHPACRGGHTIPHVSLFGVVWGNVSSGRIVSLQGVPREGPECVPKPPFRCEREIGSSARSSH
jgi:hypothetical protein